MLLMNRPPRAFTLPELLLSSMIMGFIFTATVISYMMLERMWKEGLVLCELARDTNIALEKIIRGEDANSGLQAAKAVSVPQSDTVQYKDLNDLSKTFYYSNNKIYSGGGCLLSNVSSASFTDLGKIIQIDLTTHKYVVGKEIKFRVQTKVKPRN